MALIDQTPHSQTQRKSRAAELLMAVMCLTGTISFIWQAIWLMTGSPSAIADKLIWQVPHAFLALTWAVSLAAAVYSRLCGREGTQIWTALGLVLFGIAAALPYISINSAAMPMSKAASVPELKLLTTALWQAALLLFSCILFLYDIVSLEKKRHSAAIEQTAYYRTLAMTDTLTHLYNRSAYDEHLTEGRFASGSWVVLADINGLKQINDSQGHSAGDRAIVETARCFRQAFTGGGCYRIGGDEFLCIHNGLDAQKTAQRLKEFQSLCRSCGFMVAGGMSRYDTKTDASISAAIERADKDMYQDKKRSSPCH